MESRSAYNEIQIGGGDTAMPLSLAKRLQIIRPYLLSGARRFLDCGCGEGEYVKAMIAGANVEGYGIEYMHEKVAKARRDPLLEFRVCQGDLEAIPFEDGSFDLAIMNEVLEHVPDEARALGEVHRILEPGGVFIVFSPNRWFPCETHGVYLKASGRRIPAWFPLVPYIPVSIGRRFLRYWARNYWQGQLARLVEEAGFTIERRNWIWQTFENISGHQPVLIQKTRPALRLLANTLERLPLIRRFGVSQVLIARKPTAG